MSQASWLPELSLLSRGFAEDGTPEFGNFQSGGDFPVDSALRPVISGDGSTVVFWK